MKIYWTLILIFMLPGAARAADLIHSQGLPPSATASPAPLHGQSQTAGSSEPAPLPESSQLLEIPIPEVFRGCWESTVDRLDSRTMLSGWILFTYWMPKSYKMCFVSAGRDQWRLTYSSTYVDVGLARAIESQPQGVRVVRIAGPDLLYLEAKLRLVQGSMVKDETSTIKLHVDSNDEMSAEAAVIIDWNGAPWMSATWHTTFVQSQ